MVSNRPADSPIAIIERVNDFKPEMCDAHPDDPKQRVATLIEWRDSCACSRHIMEFWRDYTTKSRQVRSSRVAVTPIQWSQAVCSTHRTPRAKRQVSH